MRMPEVPVIGDLRIDGVEFRGLCILLDESATLVLEPSHPRTIQ